MRQHSVIGERILSAAPALRPVARLVRASHERWDGTGYPDGLVEHEIPLGARIVAACDAFDAMTSDRCYQRARSHGDAVDELLRGAGIAVRHCSLFDEARLTDEQTSSPTKATMVSSLAMPISHRSLGLTAPARVMRQLLARPFHNIGTDFDLEWTPSRSFSKSSPLTSAQPTFATWYIVVGSCESLLLPARAQLGLMGIPTAMRMGILMELKTKDESVMIRNPLG